MMLNKPLEAVNNSRRIEEIASNVRGRDIRSGPFKVYTMPLDELIFSSGVVVVLGIAGQEARYSHIGLVIPTLSTRGITNCLTAQYSSSRFQSEDDPCLDSVHSGCHDGEIDRFVRLVVEYVQGGFDTQRISEGDTQCMGADNCASHGLKFHQA